MKFRRMVGIYFNEMKAMLRMFRTIRTFRNLLKFRRMVGIYFNVMKASLRALRPL